MSWIKDNKFIAALGGGTLAGAILLFIAGFHGLNKYEKTKEEFEATSTEASGFEKLALYPKAENHDGKRKSLDDYRLAVGSIQAAFEPFRPKEIKNITPQEFTTLLLAANSEIRKAFEDGGTTVPEPFFVGFERYKTSLAPGNTTGILDYQLAAIKNLMLELAKAKPAALRNLYRPNLPEEDGQAFTPAATAVARAFPLEITFIGHEESARQFLSAIAKPENHYAVVRSIRITNDKKDPPRAADAKFDKSAEETPAAGADASGGGFGGGFVLPGEETPAAAPEKPAPPAAAPKPADSGRILSQVLGSEQVQVFVRLDILQFLPAKKLP